MLRPHRTGRASRRRRQAPEGRSRWKCTLRSTLDFTTGPASSAGGSRGIGLERFDHDAITRTKSSIDISGAAGMSSASRSMPLGCVDHTSICDRRARTVSCASPGTAQTRNGRALSTGMNDQESRLSAALRQSSRAASASGGEWLPTGKTAADCRSRRPEAQNRRTKRREPARPDGSAFVDAEMRRSIGRVAAGAHERELFRFTGLIQKPVGGAMSPYERTSADCCI